LCCMVVCVGCATTSVTSTEPGSLASAEAMFPTVDITINQNTLGKTVRKIGEEVGGGLVSVYGLEDRPTGVINLHGVTYEKMVTRLADVTKCSYQKRSYYYFLYPNEYALLLDYNLESLLPERYSDMSTTIALGTKTSLFNAFAMLSDSLGITVIADNIVADAVTGEITLENAPVYAVIEALLQSALIPPNDIELDATDEYIFVYARGNNHSDTLLLNKAQLTPEQLAFLDKKINLTLPRPHGDEEAIPFYLDAFPLGDTLDSLASQIGLSITIEKEIQRLPVNHVIMNDVRVETALNLVIRQWLVPRFGYELYNDRIHIRFK